MLGPEAGGSSEARLDVCVHALEVGWVDVWMGVLGQGDRLSEEQGEADEVVLEEELEKVGFMFLRRPALRLSILGEQGKSVESTDKLAGELLCAGKGG